VYRVPNRAVGRRPRFQTDGDYRALEAALEEAADGRPVRLPAFRVVPNHWHLVPWPYADGDLSAYGRWLTVTHAQRYHAHYLTAGTGPAYQRRFKSFPVQAGDHLRSVCRYAERNAMRAGLVRKAEAWRWSGPWHRARGGDPAWPSDWPDGGRPALAAWPASVNRPATTAQLAAVRRSAGRGAPNGEAAWAAVTAERPGLGSTLRPRGRPPKARPAGEE
jgi:putative transposase